MINKDKLGADLKRAVIVIGVLLFALLPIYEVVGAFVRSLITETRYPIEFTLQTTTPPVLCAGGELSYNLQITSLVNDDVYVTRIFRRFDGEIYRPNRIVSSHILPLERGQIEYLDVDVTVPDDFEAGQYEYYVSYDRIGADSPPSRYAIGFVIQECPP